LDKHGRRIRSPNGWELPVQPFDHSFVQWGAGRKKQQFTNAWKAAELTWVRKIAGRRNECYDGLLFPPER
jgi:hypothetical protein